MEAASDAVDEQRRRRQWATPTAVKVELMTARALGGATWRGASLHLSRCRRLWPAHEKDGAVCALESTSNAHVGDVGSRTTRRWHGYRAGLKARWSGAPVKLGGVERSHELRSGGGRWDPSVVGVGDARLLRNGPVRRAVEVALLALSGTAQRPRGWSAWATTGAARGGQATLHPIPTDGGFGDLSVTSRGRTCWLPRPFLEIPA